MEEQMEQSRKPYQAVQQTMEHTVIYGMTTPQQKTAQAYKQVTTM